MNALKIYNVVKTDNDLRKPRNKETYSVLGFMRLNGLIGETILPEQLFTLFVEMQFGRRFG